MAGPLVHAADRRKFAFTSLAAGGSAEWRLPVTIDARAHFTATLLVWVHAASVQAGSDGNITVRVLCSGRTAEDPAVLFASGAVATVTAVDVNTSAGEFFTQAFYADGAALTVEVEGTQDSTTGSQTLEADLSIAVRLGGSRVLGPDAIFGSRLDTWWLGQDANTSAWVSRTGARTATATAGEEPAIGLIHGRAAPGYASPGTHVDGYVTSGATNWFPFLHDGTGGTIAVAVLPSVAGTTKYVFDEILANATRTGLALYFSGADVLVVRVGNSSGTFVVNTNKSLSGSMTEPHFAIFRFDAAQATDWSLFVDQGETADSSGNAAGTPATGAATLNPRLLARSATNTTQALDGHCGDVVLVDGYATDLEVRQLARYFAHRYRL